ncbi:type I secretion system permease/ATPase [Vibrio sp. ZSDE26]|uniref:Type I secretion system permease/ATPase n=1 Tax=Vibrio amylolyticus TaxID=2847292 RepID=A0A9X1XIM7_9VIBR|nr:type I secretion system permease/ATPase [Vibrio amylolyticus]MCK6263491.1 type I secretion system permease/ATPase [Vibrio amylolyticus]
MNTAIGTDAKCSETRSYLGTTKGLIFFIFILSAVVNILFLAIPLFSMQVFDRVLSSESKETLAMLVIIALFLITVQASLDWVRGQLMLRYGYSVEQKASEFAFNMSIMSSQHGSSINSQHLSDLKRVKQVITSPSIFALFDAPFTPIFILVMFLMHPQLGYFALGGAGVLLVISLASMFITRKLQNKSSQNVVTFNTLTNDWLKNSEMIQVLGMNNNLSRKWQQESINPTVDRGNADNITRGIHVFSKYIRMLLQIGVLCISVLLVLENEVGAGVLIAASMIMARVLAPIEQAISNWLGWHEGWKSHQRLNQSKIAQEEELISLPKIKGKIQFNDVSLGYNKDEKPLLSALSFTLPAGETLCIVGGSGVGKSSIGKAILGLMEPLSGEIRIDGATANQWQHSEFGRQVGYVSQNSQLLSGTIAQNICRFEDNIDPQDIIQASILAGVHEVILALPNGYQTLVGSLGVQLSGGQQQRIALARALYSKPALLILDEPDSNLDHSGQAALNDFLLQTRKTDTTVITISHRMSILQNSSFCMVIGDGGIQQFGKTDEVLNLSSERKSARGELA